MAQAGNLFSLVRRCSVRSARSCMWRRTLDWSRVQRRSALLRLLTAAY